MTHPLPILPQRQYELCKVSDDLCYEVLGYHLMLAGNVV